MKTRLDLAVKERGLAESREKAQALIIAGQILVDDRPVTKPGTLVSLESQIRVRGRTDQWVSRGAHKLLGALDSFAINVSGRVALDVGASTGGFTQVLLSRGAEKVFAFDVGHNQLDWKIRSDPRVVVKEGINARHLSFEDVGTEVDIIVMDVSFISVTKVLPALKSVAQKSLTDWVVLIKPQFEVGPEKIGKGGIVTDLSAREAAVEAVTKFAQEIGLARQGLIESPISGTQGNIEYLAYFRWIT